MGRFMLVTINTEVKGDIITGEIKIVKSTKVFIDDNLVHEKDYSNTNTYNQIEDRMIEKYFKKYECTSFDSKREPIR